MRISVEQVILKEVVVSVIHETQSIDEAHRSHR